MNGKYYQGEDIVITISIYNDKDMTQKENISAYEIDLMLISSDNSKLLASTNENNYLADCSITKKDDYTLIAHFDASLTSLLSVGNARIEMKMVDTNTGYTTISTNDLIFIENSDIGKLN